LDSQIPHCDSDDLFDLLVLVRRGNDDIHTVFLLLLVTQDVRVVSSSTIPGVLGEFFPSRHAIIPLRVHWHSCADYIRNLIDVVETGGAEHKRHESRRMGRSARRRLPIVIWRVGHAQE
jgi:hypothetical protein